VAKAGDEVTVVGGTTPSTANSAYWLNGTHYWATPKDLSEQKLPILSGTSRSVTDEGLATISSRLLEPGTVLLSSRAPVGYLAITEVPVAINQGFIAIKSSSNTPTGFVYEWCKNNIDEFLKHSSGTTFLELSKSSFKRISILMPVSSIISEYEDHHKDLFKRVSSNIHQIRTLTNLRDTLLPKLISGELRVPEAEQMVAELGL
jgi:type I restriction enzyme S subunit